MRASRNSSRIAIGDIVFGASTDYRDVRKAAYQEYVVTTDYNVTRIPKGVQVKEAAALGVAYVAAVAALGISFGVDFSRIRNGPSGIDFLDGIVSEFDGGWYIITGRMVDVNPQNLPLQRIIRPGDSYYFMHATDSASRQDRNRFLIPLPDYIFRYNRGIFWLGKQTLDVFGIKCTERVRKLAHNALTARMDTHDSTSKRSM